MSKFIATILATLAIFATTIPTHAQEIMTHDIMPKGYVCVDVTGVTGIVGEERFEGNEFAIVHMVDDWQPPSFGGGISFASSTHQCWSEDDPGLEAWVLSVYGAACDRTGQCDVLLVNGYPAPNHVVFFEKLHPESVHDAIALIDYQRQLNNSAFHIINR